MIVIDDPLLLELVSGASLNPYTGEDEDEKARDPGGWNSGMGYGNAGNGFNDGLSGGLDRFWDLIPANGTCTR